MADALKGLLAAVAVIGAWAVSLSWLLSAPLQDRPWWLVPLGMSGLTLLYTGLFITAHDAMHGSICRRWPMLNHGIGTLAAFVYAMFSYRRLLVAHRHHHETPARAGDPDFHDGRHPQFWRWYATFMGRYLSWKQLAGMAIAFNVLNHGFGVDTLTLVVFWVAPALLSTLQLFFFGTFLPHREPAGGYTNPHRAASSGYSVAWSFLTCFHFGYHWEHHESPSTPWWRLPAFRRRRLELAEPRPASPPR